MRENGAKQEEYGRQSRYAEMLTEGMQAAASQARLKENWKQYVMLGSFAAAAYLLITNRRPAGFAAAGIGLAVLAAEHPRHFEEAWNRAPEYLEKGQRLIQGVGRIVDQVTEQANRFQQNRVKSDRMREDYLT